MSKLKETLSTYAPKGKYLWDLWLSKDKKNSNVYHAFYLESSKTKDPNSRHDASSIGHALSDRNLKNWSEVQTVLTPGKKGEWDDLALWTGSVTSKDGSFYMFYTGRNRKDPEVQKIGIAASDDLVNWRKFKGNPILDTDTGFYALQKGKNKLGKIGTWRDPFVFQDPKTGRYCMTISARQKGANRENNGCIGLATSKDLFHWIVKRPILAPGKYDEMETSQVIFHRGKYYLFFSVAGRGLHCYCSNSLMGEHKPVNGNGLVVNAAKVYDVRLVHNDGNKYKALGWLTTDGNNKFVGKMSEPFNVVIDNNKVSIN